VRESPTAYILPQSSLSERIKHAAVSLSGPSFAKALEVEELKAVETSRRCATTRIHSSSCALHLGYPHC